MIRFLALDALIVPIAPAPLRQAAALRWSGEALVAELPASVIYFSHWGEAFGCRSVTSDIVTKLRVETCLFDRLGLWQRDATPFDLDIRSGGSLWHRYLALIPSPVRRLVAPYGTAQWRVLEQVAQEPSLVYQMDRE